MLQLFLNNLP